MADKLFYFLKSYLGFTRREARGFVFVVPVLMLLYALPFMIGTYYRARSDEAYISYLEKFASLQEDGSYTSQPTASVLSGMAQEKQQEKEHREHAAPRTALKAPERPGLNKISFSETSAVELQLVNGVGPVLSERIVAFRNKLGGFYRAEQLLEVYGVDAELAGKIYATFPFGAAITQKIDINESEVEELARHPYVGFGEAKVIVAYRNQHGPYQSADELLRIKIFNKEWVDRISPYLEF
ncbi:DNA uptake protein ComE [Cyclobacterium lianum]|uniref:DNA uptake protein ComE n=1 Tax=Cyclobacterium lianum TaxID=388280 RepID=A0A1M7PIF0_9BACT|nr:helix-hairpin-helix domain-containing protein [Cyclobacterium lianum]SHN16939.1 DNA uptake protein ComE [Cyclobacterium lianum]